MSFASFEVHRLVVLADYGQFYLQDLEAHSIWMRSPESDCHLAPAGWTEDAVYNHRIGVEPHSIAVGTARSDLVEVVLRWHLLRPEAALDLPEHVVEADLDLPHGDLAIYGPADDPGGERHVSVAPGRHRARVSYLPSDPPEEGESEDESGDHFSYQVDLWPTVEAAVVQVLKQGPLPWAG